MAVYTVKDNDTGKTISFEWNAETAPTESDLSEVFAQAKTVQPEQPKTVTQKTGDVLTQIGDWMEGKRKEWTGETPRTGTVPEWGKNNPNLYGAVGGAREGLGPILEALGMAGGAVAGGGPASPGTAAVGAGLGYAGARQGLSALDQLLGNKKPVSLPQAAKEAAIDTGTGAAMEAGGQSIVPALSSISNLTKKVATQGLGAITGAGPGTIERALQGGKSFTDAMRGKITGDEIVDNAASALRSLKEQRATSYTSQLNQIAQKDVQINTSSINDKLDQLLKNYRIGRTIEGMPKNIKPGKMEELIQLMPDAPLSLDFSRAAIGKSAQKDVAEIVDLVKTWEDKTPVGLDALKRRLGDFYSDSSQARQLVASLKDEVNSTIAKNVPEYSKMTKGYEEATRLIKEVESGLMLKKGQTADQTLRRLTSAMRENFEMRKDLVEILGKKAGDDLTGQIAGYSASQIIPRGLVGKISSGGIATLAYLNPKFWPVLAATSPRVVGEFLNIYGKGVREVSKLAPTIPSAVKSAAIVGNE